MTVNLGIKGVVFGPHGIGKTTLTSDFNPDTTLFLNAEAGDLAIKDWKGDKRSVRTWPEARVFAALIGGVNPSAAPSDSYSKEYFDSASHYAKTVMPDLDLSKYTDVLFDSITEASRLCLSWARTQPEAFNKQGQPNPLGAYGLLGRELIAWFKQFQHAPQRNIWLFGGLDRGELEGGRVVWDPQMEGSKASNELPGIFDQVVTMTQIDVSRDGKVVPQRAFICQQLNQWHYPAKDRSGTLKLIEEPNLVKLMEKIRTAPRYQANPNWEEILDDQIIY